MLLIMAATMARQRTTGPEDTKGRRPATVLPTVCSPTPKVRGLTASRPAPFGQTNGTEAVAKVRCSRFCRSR